VRFGPKYRWSVVRITGSDGDFPMKWITFSSVAFLAILVAPVRGQVGPYNPYATTEDSPPPLAADGTVQWGVFYKSAQLQRAYERLWSLGACRGSNRAITVPVAENKLVIDRLPEAEFSGVVQAATGDLAGGMVAFAGDAAATAGDGTLVAQFHPAGVTKLAVRGPVSKEALAKGAIVRFRARVDETGRASDPVSAVELVVPPAGFVPDEVRPRHLETIVGTVHQVRRDALVIRVDAGRIRRVTVDVADDVVISVDGPRLDLVAAGDRIELKGRLWAGDGAMAGGTVFASDVIVTKRPVDSAPPAPGSRTVGVR
jgi:hypothetical protein